MIEIINTVLESLIIFLLLIDLILVQKRNRELINIIERNGIVLPSIQLKDCETIKRTQAEIGELTTATIKIDEEK